VFNTGVDNAAIIDTWTNEGEQDNTVMSGGNVVTRNLFAKHIAVSQIVSNNYTPE